MDKPLNKIIGLKKTEFDELVRTKQIRLNDARLIPFSKAGDEISLTSVLLSGIRLIKEFKKTLLSDVKMSSSGKLHVFTEVGFGNHKDRPDGLLLIERGGIIADAALIELKNGTNELESDQIERYSVIAKELSIPRIITVSNQFVSEPTQSPLGVKSTKNLSYYHLSWSYILTVGHILLTSKDNIIEDEDQALVMQEVLNYFESDKSAICGLNQMKPGWTDVVNKINCGTTIRLDDENTKQTVQSWQQQEMDIALKMSRSLGLMVSSGEAKYKSDLCKRLEDDARELVNENTLKSNLRIKGAASKLGVCAYFDKRVIEMNICLRAPTDKKTKGQMSWLEKQLFDCKKRDEQTFSVLKESLRIDIFFKNTAKPERLKWEEFWQRYEGIKDKEIREFGVIIFKDFGKDFSSRTKFVSIIEKLAIDFYKVFVEHLKNGEVLAPKMKENVEIPALPDAQSELSTTIQSEIVIQVEAVVTEEITETTSNSDEAA